MSTVLILFISAGAVALIGVAIVLRGWVLSILWGWFAVPILGAPSISVAQAIGIALVAHLLTHQYVPSKEKDAWMPLVSVAINPLVSLFIGWIVKGYMP